jgi:hypothetical protein
MLGDRGEERVDMYTRELGADTKFQAIVLSRRWRTENMVKTSGLACGSAGI